MKKFNEFDWEGEEFFLALQSFNNHDASFRRLMKRKKSGEIELDEFLEIMDGIVNYIADNSLN